MVICQMSATGTLLKLSGFIPLYQIFEAESNIDIFMLLLCLYLSFFVVIFF